MRLINPGLEAHGSRDGGAHVRCSNRCEGKGQSTAAVACGARLCENSFSDHPITNLDSFLNVSSVNCEQGIFRSQAFHTAGRIISPSLLLKMIVRPPATAGQ